jgi:hypothetical protein
VAGKRDRGETPIQRDPQAQTGSVRWIRRPSGPTASGRFAITVETTRGAVTTEYDVAALLDDAGTIIGFALAKDDVEVHALDFSQWYGPTCTCRDCEFRNRACKHIQAVRAALHSAGITIPAPKSEPRPAVPVAVEFDDL